MAPKKKRGYRQIFKQIFSHLPSPGSSNSQSTILHETAQPQTLDNARTEGEPNTGSPILTNREPPADSSTQNEPSNHGERSDINGLPNIRESEPVIQPNLQSHSSESLNQLTPLPDPSHHGVPSDLPSTYRPPTPETTKASAAILAQSRTSQTLQCTPQAEVESDLAYGLEEAKKKSSAEEVNEPPEDGSLPVEDVSMKRAHQTNTISYPDEYTVGFLCVLPTEYVAVQLFLDETHNPLESKSLNDNNTYTLGRLLQQKASFAVTNF